MEAAPPAARGAPRPDAPLRVHAHTRLRSALLFRCGWPFAFDQFELADRAELGRAIAVTSGQREQQTCAVLLRLASCIARCVNLFLKLGPKLVDIQGVNYKRRSEWIVDASRG